MVPAAPPLECFKDLNPALRLTDWVDKEVLLLDYEERVVELERLAECLISGRPATLCSCNSSSSSSGSSPRSAVSDEAVCHYGLERRCIAECGDEVVQETGCRFEGHEGKADDVLSRRGSYIAHFVVIVVEGVVHAEQSSEMLRAVVEGWMDREEGAQ